MSDEKKFSELTREEQKNLILEVAEEFVKEDDTLRELEVPYLEKNQNAIIQGFYAEGKREISSIQYLDNVKEDDVLAIVTAEVEATDVTTFSYEEPTCSTPVIFKFFVENFDDDDCLLLCRFYRDDDNQIDYNKTFIEDKAK
ncbi:MAG: hypothetical protein K5644_04460 [Lachnospiraceae bacterium]|nr:hypothetical protein [Lachnospiraceae bacterium]